MKRFRYDPAAEEELVAAAQRYAAANATVGERFVARIITIVTEISREPHVWPLAPHVPENLGVRRRVVPGFPYLVLYKDYPTEVVILAIAHGKRKPGYWRRRLPER